MHQWQECKYKVTVKLNCVLLGKLHWYSEEAVSQSETVDIDCVKGDCSLYICKSNWCACYRQTIGLVKVRIAYLETIMAWNVQTRAISHLGAQPSLKPRKTLLATATVLLFCCSRDCAHSVWEKLTSCVPILETLTITLVCLNLPAMIVVMIPLFDVSWDVSWEAAKPFMVGSHVEIWLGLKSAMGEKKLVTSLYVLFYWMKSCTKFCPV